MSESDRVVTGALAGGEGRLVIEELRDRTRIRASSWIGVVRLDAFEVRVEPKYVGGNLGVVEMLDYVNGFGSLARYPGIRDLAVGGTSLIDLIALLLAEECRRLVRAGLLQDYVTRDLVAWPVGAPDHFATAMGPGAGIALLGPVAAFRAPTDKTPLRLFRNPESWLLNGCEGSVILKPEAARWLGSADVPLICDDREHARCVSQWLGSTAKKRDIFIPDIRRAA